jgi:hypothetical protein
MTNALLTPDGYFFEQLPDGTYTDGDMTFNYDMSNDMRGVVWQNMDGHYCADGDGMVVAAHDGDAWIVTDQGDVIGAFDTLRAAIMCAQQQLATNYPEIYENHVGEL